MYVVLYETEIKFPPTKTYMQMQNLQQQKHKHVLHISTLTIASFCNDLLANI